MRIAILPFSLSNDMEKYLWNEADEPLKNYEGYVLTGNISDLLMEEIRSQAHSGKPVLGIGQGAQILLESGLMPGLENDKPCITLIDADDRQEETHMRVSDHYQLNAFTQHLGPKDILSLHPPFEKKMFVIAPALLMEMQLLGSTVFQYCDEHGKPGNFIAAVSNKMGNVMAMINHPVDSSLLFQSMQDYIQKGYVQQVTPMHYYPR